MRLRILVACAAAALLAACNPQPPKAPANASPTPGASASATPVPLHITGQGTKERPVRIVQARANQRQYELLAHSYESNGAQGTARATFSNVHVTFYGHDGSSMIADAPRALVDESANTVTLIDRVHARNSNGMKLQCDRLVYSRDTGMLHGTGNVIITNAKGMSATGNRFDSDITMTQTRMQ
jgi:LPS export ABC transporter protein LptC